MSTPAYFAIPPQFQDQLEHAEPLDDRTNDEILESLTHHRPVTGEKNLWGFWHAGVQTMPEWCKRNVADWHRICGPSWTIRILDTVPGSSNHALKHHGWPLRRPHSADFVRGATLALHGGIFMDVGIILTRSLDRICWSILEDPSTPYQVCVPWMYGLLIANHFTASRKGDPFITRWHQLFIHAWKHRTNFKGMSQNPLFEFAQSFDFAVSREHGFTWDFNVDPTTVYEYITQVLAWLRLCRLEDAGDGFCGADYAIDNILWFHCLAENWGIEEKIGFEGQNVFDLLATRLDADPESEEYKSAYNVVWHHLARCSMQKIAHGKNLTATPALGVLWDRAENEGRDIESGTFAELLRYGTTHFRQTREGIQFIKVERAKQTMRKGVLEP
ncbi:hypothetical protein BDV06DRAFT_216872 [Aspergillus oleicola]